MDLNKIRKHIRSRPYMDGIERTSDRVKDTEEVFTTTPTVQESLDLLEYECPDCFEDPTKTFLDNCCGDGQFLGEVLIRKMENGIDFETALSTIYGVELMEDNVKRCREHLLCGQEIFRHIVDKNIVCHDALTYHYKFDGTSSTSHLESLGLMQNSDATAPNKVEKPKQEEVETTMGDLFG